MPKLHLGCGRYYLDDYINIDFKSDDNVHPDVVADIRCLPFKDNSIKEISAYHVFEHIPRQESMDVLEEWKRVLSQDGKLEIECPDFERNCIDFLKSKDDVDKMLINMAFIFGGDSAAPEDAHRWGYSAGVMRRMLEDIGFISIRKLIPITHHADQAACFRVEAIK